MSGLTSGVGLFSGINTAQLIDQLISLEARPKQQVQQRLIELQGQRAAYLDINTSVLSLKTAAQKFRVSNIFKTSRATSSDQNVLTATAGTTAAAGTYQFVAKRLVSTQQLLSRSFADADTSAVNASSFTFELGGGQLATETRLSELNGGAGVERGKIIVTDAAGASTTIDLSTAVTVDDVLSAFNTASGVRIRATVDGDRIKVIDTNTSGSGALTIANATGYNTATSLGIAGTSSPGFGQAITGSRIRLLSTATSLASLNDGLGVNIRDGSDDLVITSRDGSVHHINLGLVTHVEANGPGTADDQTVVDQTRATTLQDVITYINAQTGGKVTAALNPEKTGLVLTDHTDEFDVVSNLIVRSATSDRTTARDLGIETAADGVDAESVSGRRLIAGLNSLLVSTLRGGSGITDNSLTITDRDGTVTNITIGGSALAGSLDDVIKDINTQLEAASGQGVRVKLNRAGNGLALEDQSGIGSGNISASGAAATALGIAASGATGGSFNGSNLQAKWISRSTLVSSLNGGRGIGTGTIRITDGTGSASTITIGESIKTVDDLVKFISSASSSGISADINANGDGIVVRSTFTGAGTLKIEDVTGTVAKSLNLVGSDNNDDNVLEINGSYERTVTFAANDTLSKIASKINAAGVSVAAAVIRDGSGARLSFTSQRSGAIGRATIDTGALDLGLSTLSRGDDSVAFYGSGDPARAVLLTGSSNVLDNVIQGVTIDLKQTSATPVTLTITRDTETIEKTVSEFVTAYNAMIDKLARYDAYNSDTKQATSLFGDQTIGSLRGNLRRIVQGTPDGATGSFTRLFQVGVSMKNGTKLEFDAARFRAAMEQDPAAVEALFSARDMVPRGNQVTVPDGDSNPDNDPLVNNTSNVNTFTRLGILEKLGEFASNVTSSVDGTLSRRGRSLDSQITSGQARIAQFDVRLAAKRARLERQFAGMEKAIASLQTQSGALGSLSVR
ncbi:MAG: flagellar filament capping protein FliD [Phycisphaerae bacterium]|nr:flagellar filament capping protein FliD [Phycisphaerae bacterium]